MDSFHWLLDSHFIAAIFPSLTTTYKLAAIGAIHRQSASSEKKMPLGLLGPYGAIEMCSEAVHNRTPENTGPIFQHGFISLAS
jgi:hypothetical protein